MTLADKIELLLTVIAAHGSIGYYTLVDAVGLRHGVTFRRTYSDALDALVAAGTVKKALTLHSPVYTLA